MKTTKFVSGLLLGALLLTSASGCLLRVHARGSAEYEVEDAPPPPRHVYVDARPGWVWVEGYWFWNGNQWVWYDGRWERERTGYVWVQGRWTTHGHKHKWVPGYWAKGNGRVIVRERHDNGNHNGWDKDKGPKERDHRDKDKKEHHDDHDDDRGPKKRDHRD